MGIPKANAKVIAEGCSGDKDVQQKHKGRKDPSPTTLTHPNRLEDDATRQGSRVHAVEHPTMM